VIAIRYYIILLRIIAILYHEIILFSLTW